MTGANGRLPRRIDDLIIKMARRCNTETSRFARQSRSRSQWHLIAICTRCLLGSTRTRSRHFVGEGIRSAVVIAAARIQGTFNILLQVVPQLLSQIQRRTRSIFTNVGVWVKMPGRWSKFMIRFLRESRTIVWWLWQTASNRFQLLLHGFEVCAIRPRSDPLGDHSAGEKIQKQALQHSHEHPRAANVPRVMLTSMKYYRFSVAVPTSFHSEAAMYR